MIETAAEKVFEQTFNALGDVRPRLILCVSGGIDSVCLLRIFRILHEKRKLSCEPAIFHMDHKVRPESAEDASFCASLARECGFAFYLETMSASVFARRARQSIEEAGRTLRYRAMARLERLLGEPCVFVTAHHADDYLESVLMHLARGGGAGALSTLPLVSLVHGVTVFRPLLILDRPAIEECMKNVAYREDSTNSNSDYKRNRMRAQVIPILRQEGLDPVRMWRNFHDLLAWQRTLHAPDVLEIDREMFTSSPRVLKTALDAACMRLGLGPPGETVIGELLSQSSHRPFRIRFQSKELLLWADERSPCYVFPAHSPLLQPPRIERIGAEWTMVRERTRLACALEPGWSIVLPAPGMRFPLGAGRKKLAKLFKEQSVPSFVRRFLPVAVDGSGLVRMVFFSFWKGQDRRF